MDDTDTNKIIAKLKNVIPECCNNDTTTYYDVLKAISKNFTAPVYIVGGCVRDYMITKDTETMNDIDINYTILPEEVENSLKELQIKNFYKDNRNYIRVGPKNRSDYLEGFYIIPTSYSEYSLESKMNSLLFLIDSNKIYLIDLYGGDSLTEALSKIWSSPSEDYSKWMLNENNPKLLWRLLKFELRGYSVPSNTKRAVYNDWITRTTISDYYWQNMWWTLEPSKLKEIINLIKKDCLEVDINYGDLFQLLINKNLLIANKI